MLVDGHEQVQSLLKSPHISTTPRRCTKIIPGDLITGRGGGELELPPGGAGFPGHLRPGCLRQLRPQGPDPGPEVGPEEHRRLRGRSGQRHPDGGGLRGSLGLNPHPLAAVERALPQGQ